MTPDFSPRLLCPSVCAAPELEPCLKHVINNSSDMDHEVGLVSKSLTLSDVAHGMELFCLSV